ncbi:transglutaminase-like domain-containing protein [Streptomyces sp. NPDC088354]|uniref:transglutaminase-like domain-containing protein n=1 Tax=unclassified Streptomyces TaxID=2593676 RepID=UPI0029A4B5E8|nr:transglutaminase-like domain-containing protein [Streptomyces sp. MI02-7b]MDX3078128.1 transglutaminase-like domain-containing protein [Streptomyces sp. MI02-7b]
MDDSVRRRFAEAAREPRPDLATLCLLVGEEADPGLGEAGTDAAQIELDRLAGLLPYGLTGPADWAAATAALLGGRLGFGGTPADYQRLDSSLLHEVLRRRRGLPILLSVVWIEVARRAGAPVYGVALPGHFVVGFGDPAGAFVLADPFNGGRPLGDEDVRLLVAGATGSVPSPAMLGPADPLDIVLRVLNNIRAWADARPEHLAVQLWAVELSLLLPQHPGRLRQEHAQLLVRAGDFARGAAEMEACAEVLDAAEPGRAGALRHQARAARALLN